METAMKKCPVCGEELAYGAGIGEYCANVGCPVVDDANLWKQSPEGWSRPAPAKLQLPPSNDMMREALRGGTMSQTGNEVIFSFPSHREASDFYELMQRF
jgi:hypothetical protein